MPFWKLQTATVEQSIPQSYGERAAGITGMTPLC